MAGDSELHVDESAQGDVEAPIYLNRELSWLAFNERVLGEAARGSAHPLLERVKFLAIAANNLDEFFMVRVATLRRAAQSEGSQLSIDGMSRSEELTVVRERAAQQLNDLDARWQQLRPELERQGIAFVDREEYSAATRSYLAQRFSTDIFPILTPLAFDPGHPFPYMSNRSNNIAVVVSHAGRLRFARVKVPDVLPRFIPLPAAVVERKGQTLALLEDVILDNIQTLFPGAEVRSAHLFRILRDADIVLAAEDAEDLLESVDQTLKRMRHGQLIMLKVDRQMPARVLNILLDNFEAEPDVVHAAAGRMCFADWAQLTELNRPDLQAPPFEGRSLWQDADAAEIFAHLQRQDVLVHHPFDAYDTTERFLHAATHDPGVVAIKMTLYRLEPNSQVIDLLIEAADRGKQIAVLLELKARFDERSNITWANRLEEAGIHVVYGQLELKTHCKVCLVVRQEGEAVRRYAHIGTGNYNRAEARIYTDLGLFTAREDIVTDISGLFNQLTGYASAHRYQCILVAPINMRARMKALLEREIGHARAGRPARVIFKTNAISDPDFIADLYAAAASGVQLDLIVRGICCARPGVPGTADAIRVRSIVGRFFEHTRFYWFENGGDHEVYLGSADLMERNFNRRIEILCPVLDPEQRALLRDGVLEAYLRDNTGAHALGPDGTYHLLLPAPDTRPFNAQEFLMTHPLGESLPPIER